MWKIPPMDGKAWVESAHMVLRGHRSIVNQVRYNQVSCIFASSGVEKIIKIWSPFPLGTGCLGGLKVAAAYNSSLQITRYLINIICHLFRRLLERQSVDIACCLFRFLERRWQARETASSIHPRRIYRAGFT